MPDGNPTPSDPRPRDERTRDQGPEIAGVRLDKTLASSFSDLSRSRLQGLIDSGHASVNGRSVKASTRLREGDVVHLRVPAVQPTDLQPERGDFRILFEDPSLIVVSKPAGMVVHPGAGVTGGTLAAALLQHCGALSTIGGVNRPGIVHRLDKGTSGLMVVAKNDEAHQSLSEQFKTRSVEKMYAAVCLGTPKPSKGSIRLPIGRDPVNRKRMAVVEGARSAHTEYETTESFGVASVLRVVLHTGRTHQIRVHMAARKSPLVGDATYGARALSQSAPPAFRTLLSDFPRPALHSHVLSFRHPVSAETMRFEDPWPRDLAGLVDSLRDGALQQKGRPR